MIFILTNPDIGTHYLSIYTKSLIENCENGKSIVCLEGKEVTNKNLRSRIEKHKPSFVCFNGHGTPSSLIDNDFLEFISVKDKEIFVNRVVFTRACDCVKELGKESVKSGCKAFIGYSSEFWIPRIHEMASRPLKDPLARPVIENSNIVAEELIKGKSVKEAIQKAHNDAASKISQIIYDKDPYKSPILQALLNNDSHLTYEGDCFVNISI